jgi:hypothetical protein
MPFNRRTFMRQAGASLASLFVVGRLDLGAAFGSEEHDLCLAAAATFEFVLQEAILPNASFGEFPVATDEMRRTAKEISLLLKPHNAPAVFNAARLSDNGGAIQLDFSDEVRVTITPDRVELLKQFVLNFTGNDEPDLSDVTEFLETELLTRLRDSDNYTDD